MAAKKHKTALNVESLEHKALLTGFAPMPSIPAPVAPISHAAPAPGLPTPYAGISYSLTTSNTVYQAGEPILMTFTETNVSSHPIKIGEGPSINRFVVMQN